MNFLEHAVKIELATDAILAAVQRNQNITIPGLEDELERGAIDGWLHLAAVRACDMSQWSGAMQRVIRTLRGAKAMAQFWTIQLAGQRHLVVADDSICGGRILRTL